MKLSTTKTAPSSNSELRLEMITMTPSMAASLLESGDNYRSTKDVIYQMVDDMKNGKWQNNGETIKVDRNGVMLDGFHRCLSCVRSGCAFETCIAWNVEPEYLYSIDAGKPRTFNDALHHQNVRKYNLVAASVRLCWSYEHCSLTNFGVKLGVLGLLDYFNTNLDIADIACDTRIAGGVLRPSVGCMIVKFADKRFGSQPIDFVDAISSGKGLRDGTGAFRLRDRLLRESRFGAGKMKLKTNHIAILAVRAFNADLSGQPIGNLKLPRDSQGHVKQIDLVSYDDVL